MKVIFSNRAYTSVLAETTEKIKTETGGLFLGIVEGGIWYIIEAIDPGPKSIFEVAYFEYDQKYTQHLINKIANYYNVKLDLIGLWHRHPGSFDMFSTTDNGTNTKFAQMRHEGAISALVNIDPHFRITMYHVSQPCKYTQIKYEVGDELIPDKYFEFKTQEKYEKIMQNILFSNNSTQEEYHKSVSLKSFMGLVIPLMNEYICKEILDYPQVDSLEVKNKIIDDIIDDIDFISNDLNIEVNIVQKDKQLLVIQNELNKIIRIIFIYHEREDKTIFNYDGINYYYEKGLFRLKYDEFINNKNNNTRNIKKIDIEKSFYSFLKSLGINRNKK